MNPKINNKVSAKKAVDNVHKIAENSVQRMRSGKDKPGSTNQARRTAQAIENSTTNKWNRFSRNKMEPTKFGGLDKNDVSWYTHNPEIVIPYTKLPFRTVMGRPFNYLNGNSNNHQPISFLFMPFIPCYGVGETAHYNDALNIVGLNLWTFMRSKNSRTSTDYEFQDLMMYLMAVENLHCFIDLLHFVWKAIKTYSFANRDLPIALLKGMGIKYDGNTDAYSINDFYGAMKVLESKCATYAVPTGWTYYNRHKLLNAGLFADDQTRTTQLIKFVQAGFFMWDPDISTGSRLTLKSYVPITGTHTGVATLDELITFGNNLINALINDTDIANMQSDILRAFGEENLQEIEHASFDDVLMITINPDILNQITNSQTRPVYDNQSVNTLRNQFAEMGDTSQGIKSSITQSANGILQFTFSSFINFTSSVPSYHVLQEVVCDFTAEVYARGYVLNNPTDSDDPNFVIESTRNVNVWNINSSGQQYIESAGSEIFGIPYIGPINHNPNLGSATFKSVPTYLPTSFLLNDSSGSAYYFRTDTTVLQLPQLVALLQMNFHPPLQGFAVVAQSQSTGSDAYRPFDITSVSSTQIGMRLDSYTIVSPSTISRLNDGIRTNMLSLPSMGIKNIQ